MARGFEPDQSLNQLVRSNQVQWKPLDEPGVTGIHVRVLRFDTTSGRAPTILLRFDPGASYRGHAHPGGEEIFVLEGDVRVGKDLLRAGDYLYTAPHNIHAVHSDGGCVMLVVVPQEVEVLRPTGDREPRFQAVGEAALHWVTMDGADLGLLSRAVESLLGRESFSATVEGLEAELARSTQNYMWVSVELGSIPCEMPPGIRSCWIFHLRRDVPSGAHYHPNSVQHMVMVRGRGMSNVGGVLRPLIPFASPAASLAEKWLVIGRGVTHEFTPDGENMTVVSFHTCHAGELVEIDCGTGTARRYEPPDG